MKRLLTISTLLCLVTSVSAQIEQDSTYEIPEMIIGIQKTDVLAHGETPHDELSNQSIEATTSQSVGEASKYFPGVLVKDYGGLGGLKTVSVRGLGAEHTAVMWDGIKLSAAQSGQVDLSQYPVLGLDYIRLNKVLTMDDAATASAYNSAAVLELRSKDYLDSGRYQITSLLQYGSFDFFQGEVSVLTQPTTNTFVGINSRWMSSSGDYSYHYENGESDVEGRRENSALKMGSVEGLFATRFSEKLSLNGKVFYAKSDNELPGAVVFYNPTSRQHQQSENLFGQLELSYQHQKWVVKYRAKVGHQYMRYRDPDYLNSTGGIDDRYKQNEYFNSLAASYELLPSGFIYLASDLSANVLHSNVDEMPAPTRTTTQTVLGFRGRQGKLSWNGNVLFTHYEEKEQQEALRIETPGLTPTLGLRYQLISPLAVRASYKQTYRVPTFNELYYVRVGNQNLVSERAHLWNAGLVSQHFLYGKWLNEIVFSADGFYQQVENKIVAIPTQNLFVWSMQNIGKVNIAGVDVSVSLKTKRFNLGALQLQGNYSYQQALDVSDPTASNYNEQIPYVPYESGSTVLRWIFQDFTVGYSAVYSGFRYAMPENTQENIVEAWNQHDVMVSWRKQLAQYALTFRAEVLNLTNENYDVVRYYPMPGRQWRGSVIIAL